MFTGILLADSVARGLVRMDDPVEDYVSKNARVPSYRGAKIRLSHLTSHTSGLPRNPANLFGRGRFDYHEPFAQ